MKISNCSRGARFSAYLSKFCLLLTVASVQAEDYSKAVQADGPLAYYRLDDIAAALPPARNSGSLGTAGDGTHINTLRSIGGAITGSGNGSIYFDGSGARTIVPFTPALNPPAAQSFTIEAWVKPTIDGLGNAQAPLFNRRSTSPRQGWVFFQRSAGQGFNFRMYNGVDGNQSVDITGGSYTVGEWTHLAVSWSGSTATLYVNGSNVGSQSGVYAANTESPFSIGAYGANNPGDNPYTGFIDEVAFYESALSGPQVLAHYNNGTNAARATGYEALVTNDGAVLALRMNEPNAINLGSLGAKTDGTHTVGVKLGSEGALAGSTDTAATYSALARADGGSPTTIPYDPALNPTGSFTIEAWVKPTIDGLSNAQSHMHNRASTALNGGGNRTGWDFFQRGSGVGWNWRLFNGNGGTRVFDLTGGPYTVGEWHHLVAVYNATGPSATLYQNGEVVATSSSPNGTYAPKQTGDLAFGSFGNPVLNDLGYENAFTGSLDEVAIYPAALSLAQIQAHYQNGVNPVRTTPYESLITSDSPAGYWRLNESPHDPATNLGTVGAVADGMNANTLTIDGPQAQAFAGFGPTNKARNFDGIESYIEIDNLAGLNFGGPITLEAWIKPEAVQNPEVSIFSHGSDHNESAETSLRIENSNYQIGTTVAGTSFDANPDLGTAEWVHLVGTFDGTRWNLYRNGVSVASDASPSGAMTVDSATWAIGSRGRWKNAFGILAGAAMPDRAFTGGIDEVAIYDYALSPAQAAFHYSAALFGDPSLTIARSDSNTEVTLTWATGILQESDSLNDEDFTDIATVSPVTLPIAPSGKFYRLRFP